MSPFSGDNVTWAFNFVKCSPSKGIVHSGRCRKLRPIYAFFFSPNCVHLRWKMERVHVGMPWVDLGHLALWELVLFDNALPEGNLKDTNFKYV